MSASAQLKIAIPKISKNLSHSEIHSVSEYVIFDELLRSLVKFNSNGELAPDLAESWEIKDNYKKIIFKIKPNEKFSDGSIITVDDISNSLQYLLKNSDIIHGNGKKLKSIKPLKNDQLEIELLESNPFFLTELSAPEYRIVKNIAKNYSITSGPYYIYKYEPLKKVSLKLNLNYPFDTKVKYDEVEYYPYEILENNDIKKFDIIWPTSTMNQSEINKIKEQGYFVYTLNLGFSYWLSLNPNTLSLQERIQIKKNLDVALKDSTFFSDNNLTKSQQLFLPYGPGRLTDQEIHQINSKLLSNNSHNPKKIKILLPKSIQSELLDSIKLGLKNLEIHFYRDFLEYSNLIKNAKFDIALVNNDLSSIDLRSSLLVTFNKSRPLVWLENANQDYELNLNNISTELNSLKRYASIKKLGEKILSDVLVYPLYYDYGFMMVKKGIDLSQLNVSGAETVSWKIK